MTKKELLKGLKVLTDAYGYNVGFTEYTPEINKSAKQLLGDLGYLDGESLAIRGAYMGFCVGREYGFELGKNFVFDYTPEEK